MHSDAEQLWYDGATTGRYYMSMTTLSSLAVGMSATAELTMSRRRKTMKHRLSIPNDGTKHLLADVLEEYSYRAWLQKSSISTDELQACSLPTRR